MMPTFWAKWRASWKYWRVGLEPAFCSFAFTLNSWESIVSHIEKELILSLISWSPLAEEIAGFASEINVSTSWTNLTASSNGMEVSRFKAALRSVGEKDCAGVWEPIIFRAALIHKLRKSSRLAVAGTERHEVARAHNSRTLSLGYLLCPSSASQKLSKSACAWTTMSIWTDRPKRSRKALKTFK